MMMKKEENKREIYVYTVCFCMTAAAFFASLCIGKYPLGLQQIISIVTGQETEDLAKNVFFNLRLPRTIMALLAGIGLSAAGSIYQSIFRNPLAAPDLIGVSSGAGAGAAFSIVCLHSGVAGGAFGAFIGGLMAVTFSVVLAGMTRQRSTSDFVVAGIAVKAMADAFIMLMKYMADPERQLASIDYWLMGSFSSVTSDKLWVSVPLIFVSLAGIFLFRWKISLLMLSDDEASTLGVRVHLVRCVILAMTTLLVAAIICVTGSIAFIGLIAPHIASLLLKRSSFASVTVSGLLGSFILLVSDILARSAAASEIPVSILTSVIGVPVLMYLLFRKGR